MRHRADPPLAALPVLARLTAQGLLAAAEADAALAAAGPAGDAAGWQARRRWALDDAVAASERARAWAARRLARAVAPLLAARASRDTLRAAAADPSGLLRPHEVAALLEREVARALRQPRG
jgi:hypothetical protein